MSLMKYVCLSALLTGAVPQLLRAENARVSVISTMEKLRRDQHPQVNARDRIELHAARGEAESGQLVVSAKGQAIGSVIVKSSPLVSTEGGKISPEIHEVGYMQILHPTPDGYGQPGDYPDILKPLRGEFSVPSGESRAIWYTIRVPMDARPGSYQGAVVFQIGKEKKEVSIPVSLTVYPTVLPRAGILKTAFGYSPWIMRRPEFYGRGWDGSELEKKYIEQMLDYRLNPGNTVNLLTSLPEAFEKDATGQWKASWEAFDRDVEQQMAEGRNFFLLTTFPLNSFVKRGKQLSPREGNRVNSYTPDDQAQILRLMNEHFVKKGIADHFAFKLFDEPGMSAHNVAVIQETADFIHQHAPDLRLSITTTDTRERQLASDVPRYMWVPHLPSLVLSSGYESFLTKRRAMGEPGWFYICVTRITGGGGLGHPFADVGAIDRTGTSQRVFGAMAWKNRMDGFLYWEAADWRYQGGIFNPENRYKGEGVLFYPNLEERGVPFPSVRAALLRDGFEDHDLLALLERKMKEVEMQGGHGEARSKALRRAKKALDVSLLVPNLKDFNRDPSAYEAHHQEVLEALHELEALS